MVVVRSRVIRLANSRAKPDLKSLANKVRSPVTRSDCEPNGLGIYDMSGNVAEWLNDRYDKRYYRKTPRDNPQGPEMDKKRVLRGSSWRFGAGGLRTSDRFKCRESFKCENLGFRCAATP